VKESVSEIFKALKEYLAKPSEPAAVAKKGKERKPASDTNGESTGPKKRGRKPKAE
jgi:hypothetical protein